MIFLGIAIEGNHDTTLGFHVPLYMVTWSYAAIVKACVLSFATVNRDMPISGSSMGYLRLD